MRGIEVKVEEAAMEREGETAGENKKKKTRKI